MWIRGDKMESREIKRIMSVKELPDVMTMPIVASTLGSIIFIQDLRCTMTLNLSQF